MTIIVARALQLLGLFYLPFGLYRGYTQGDVRGEMVFLAIGILMFLGGRWIEHRGRGA